MTDDSSIRRGTGNIFADLGFPDAETHFLKAGLVRRIGEIIADKRLTQAEAAERMGLSQPDVSRLTRGQFRDVSVERLLRMLTRLGCEVEIVLREPGRPATARDVLQFHAERVG